MGEDFTEHHQETLHRINCPLLRAMIFQPDLLLPNTETQLARLKGDCSVSDGLEKSGGQGTVRWRTGEKVAVE